MRPSDYSPGRIDSRHLDGAADEVSAMAASLAVEFLRVKLHSETPEHLPLPWNDCSKEHVLILSGNHPSHVIDETHIPDIFSEQFLGMIELVEVKSYGKLPV